MRILVANKFWYHRGGLERVMFDEIAWLEDAGHEVAHFSTNHPQNDPSPWSDYFVPYMELGESGGLGTRAKLLAATKMFYNREAAKRFTRLLVEFRPDVIHSHGIHRQLSPSILLAAKDRLVPVVQTLHDYWPVCPADVLLRGDGALCDPGLCSVSWPWAACGQRCVQGSRGRSALSAAETFTRNTVLHYQDLISRFISPSRFLADRVIAGGLDRRPIDVIPNAVSLPPAARGGDGFVYAGRLSREKGLQVLLQAAARSGVSLTVCGDGPLAPLVRAHVDEQVTWVGSVSPVEVAGVLATARAAVVPSTWFENAPMSVLEPMAAGIPVVASAIGGIPEVVRDRMEGLLVQPESVAELSTAMSLLDSKPSLAAELGAAARDRIGTRFSRESHLSSLLECYESAERLPNRL